VQQRYWHTPTLMPRPYAIKPAPSMVFERRFIQPRHPQTNGTGERFTGRISELLQQTRFAFSARELNELH
jgi:hypothetical protein